MKVLPKYEGGDVVATPCLTKKSGVAGFNESDEKLRVMFTEHSRYPNEWDEEENALLQSMKMDLS